MHYKDSIIKVNILPKVKQINDGKQDVMVVIPLTDILEKQARASFLQGVTAVMELIAKESEITIDNTIFTEKLVEWTDDVH